MTKRILVAVIFVPILFVIMFFLPTVVLAAVVLSVYYPGRWGFYGYAMNVRYGMSQDNSVHVQLSFDMGRWYLLIVTMVICIAGILFIRRKDVLKNE